MHGPVCLSKQTIRFGFVSFEIKTKNCPSLPRPLSCYFYFSQTTILDHYEYQILSLSHYLHLPERNFGQWPRYHAEFRRSTSLRADARISLPLRNRQTDCRAFRKRCFVTKPIEQWVATRKPMLTISKVIAEYFLAQRIKSTAKN